MQTIKVILADDHTVLRDGLSILLNAEPGIEVVGDASNGREAVRKVIEMQPDVVIMDIVMPELNGIEAAKQIADVCPDVQVIILSMHATSEHIFRVLQAGANGYLLKEVAGDEVVDAVRAVYEGQRYLSQDISQIMIEDYMRQRAGGETLSPLARLSPREREVLQLVVEGKSNADIAQMLTLSPDTVKTYRSRMMQKLGISDLPALVKFAIQHGFTSLE